MKLTRSIGLRHARVLRTVLACVGVLDRKGLAIGLMNFKCPKRSRLMHLTDLFSRQLTFLTSAGSASTMASRMPDDPRESIAARGTERN
jgi:hypothetical protein